MAANSQEEDAQRLISATDADGRPLTYDANIQSRYEDHLDKGEKYNTYSKAAFIGAGALAGAAMVFLIWEAVDDPQPTQSAFVPVVGNDYAGMTATWSF